METLKVCTGAWRGYAYDDSRLCVLNALESCTISERCAMKNSVGVVQFGTCDCSAEGFCYIVSKSWPYVTERARVIEGSTTYCVDMILESELLVKGCSKDVYFFRKLY
jgi:hypothetical protein